MNGTPRYVKVMAGAALVMASAAVFLSVLLFTRVETTTTQTNAALCTFRSDVQERLRNGEAFLREHPNGIPGIPVASLRQSFDGQRRTIAALRGLDCRSARRSAR